MESLGSHFKHKIKSAAEIAAIIGPPPRQRKVIMCHGVFDVVHPGHLRHLLYAKSKADILVASLTADHHIAKGRYRPHVPQDLRAINLADLTTSDFENVPPLKIESAKTMALPESLNQQSPLTAYLLAAILALLALEAMLLYRRRRGPLEA